MTLLADDPTAAAVLGAVPCYPMPPHGRSPAVDALRAARAGRGLVVGTDGVTLIVRRPWLALDIPLTPPLAAHVPYGHTGGPRADLRCGLIPSALLAAVLDHFRAALPNEAAAFLLWNEVSGAFALDFPAIEEATPSRLVYRTPALAPDWHLVCDIHSHGTGAAFFSATDDADDAHAAKIALVFGHRPIRVLLVGCGGNGAQMLMGLASLDTALRAISSRSLSVTVVDDDVVTEANLGRQPFYRCDIGSSKARTLVERINLAHGLGWTAVHGRAPAACGVENVDLLISCVDTASARRALGSALAGSRTAPAYWMDLGNRASDGQYLIGCPARGTPEDAGRLPTVLEAFPELADESVGDDDAPSCSVAEALERQSLFVNRVVASHALALLFDLLGRGSIGHAGAFINLASGQSVPIPLPRAA